VQIYLHSPNTPSWRGAQLKRKGTGTILPLHVPLPLPLPINKRERQFDESEA